MPRKAKPGKAKPGKAKPGKAKPGKGNLRFSPRNDPVTFEVLRHRLWQINDEQGKTIINVSGSPVASEGNDFNVALTNADGEVVAIGPYIVAHVSAISLVIQSAIDLFGDGRIAEGDMYLTNDPWLGAAHQNDVCVIQPVFWDGTRVAWTASVIHQVDVGGPRPGSWNPYSHSVFDEAPRYRLLRIVRGGETQPEVIATCLTNSRLPDLVELDLRAQIAAANVACERLHELIVRYGVTRVVDAMADVLDYAQILFRKKLLGFPDGHWYAEDYLDHDGHNERVYTVRCALEKKGDRLLFDFTGTSGQAPGFINTAYGGAVAGAYAAVFPYLSQDMPWNAGVLRQIDLIVEEGTVHNARFPAPVGFGVVHAAWATTNAVALALGKMLASSPNGAEDAMAGWSGSTYVYNIFGEDDRGWRFATMLLSSDLQGCGARAFGDGYDVGGKLYAPRAKVANIESIEASYPVLYLYRRRTVDSGGAGRWRGGVSGEVAFTPHGTARIDFTVNTVGVNHSSTSGLCGGYPGGGTAVLLKRGTDLADHWRQGRLPLSWSDLSGELETLPAKSSFSLEKGDIFGAVPHGGGGFGDPLRREAELVFRDIAQGLVSREWADKLYGVALDERGQLDHHATGELRKVMRRRRIEEAESAGPLPSQAGRTLSASAAEPFGALLVSGGWLFCANCHCAICAADNGVKGHLLRTCHRMGDSGPWLSKRWDGSSPDFELRVFACPHCGGLIAVEQHLKNDPTIWEDVLAPPTGKPLHPGG